MPNEKKSCQIQYRIYLPGSELLKMIKFNFYLKFLQIFDTVTGKDPDSDPVPQFRIYRSELGRSINYGSTGSATLMEATRYE